jgi:hypothetical protein
MAWRPDTTSAGDTQVSRLSSSSFARPTQAPGKIARQPMLVASCGPLVTCRMGKGTRAAAHTASKKLNQERGIPRSTIPSASQLLLQVQLNLWVRFLQYGCQVFGPRSERYLISPCGWEDLVSFGLIAGVWRGHNTVAATVEP